MIIEDIYGNELTNPNLQKGRLGKSQRENEEGESYDILIYFPFSTDEQATFNLENEANITQDKATCAIYESTKATITYEDTDPFCYAYAREVDRGNKTIAECPSELQARIQELVHTGNDITIQLTGVDVTYYEDPEGEAITSITKTIGSTATINVAYPESCEVASITDNKGTEYTLDEDNNISVSFDEEKTITTVLIEPIN